MGKSNRALMGKSLTEISDASGISISYLSLIVNNKRKANKVTLARIGAVLNLSIEEVQVLINQQFGSSLKNGESPTPNDILIEQTLVALEHFNIQTINRLRANVLTLKPSEFILKTFYLLWVEGIIAARKNQFEEALRLLNKAQKFKAKTTMEKRMLAKIYGGLGSVYIALGNHKMSLNYFKKSLRLWNNGNDASLVYLNLGTLFRRMNRYSDAIRAYNLSLEMGFSYVNTLAYSGLGKIYLDLNNMETARQILLKGYVHSKKIEDKWGYQDLLCNLGIYYKKSGRLKRAEFIFNRGLKYALKLEATRMKDFIQLELAEVFLLQDKKEKASEIFNQVIQGVSMTGDLLLLGTSYLLCAKKCIAAFKEEKAFQYLQKSYQALSRMDAPVEILECCELLLQYHSRKHNITQVEFIKNEIKKLKNEKQKSKAVE